MSRTHTRITAAVAIAASSVLVVAAPGAGSPKAAGKPSVVARIETGKAPCSEAGGFGYLWFANNGDGTLVRIDPATNAVTARIDVGPGPCGVAIAAGSVWVDGYASASVIRVDPQTLKVVKRIPMGDQIWDITVGAGSVWATGTSSNFVARINPLGHRGLGVERQVEHGLAGRPSAAQGGRDDPCREGAGQRGDRR